MQLAAPQISPIVVLVMPEKAIYSEPDFWVAIATLLLAFFTYRLAAETKGLRVDSVATGKAAAKSVLFLEQQLRASFAPSADMHAIPGFHEAHVSVKNHGRVPFKIVRLVLYVRVSGERAKDVEVVVDDASSQVVVPQVEGFSADVRYSLPGPGQDRLPLLELELVCTDLGGIAVHRFRWKYARYEAQRTAFYGEKRTHEFLEPAG